MKSYNNYSRREVIVAVIFSGSISIIFHILLLAIMDLSLNKKNEIKNIIFSETPIYNFIFSPIKPFSDKKYIESFFEFQGKKQNISEKGKNKTIIAYKKNITKIYQQYFIYEKDKRNYFDYRFKYTVKPGEDCPPDLKQCGIFNAKGRILCLPNNENCPLNDFAISVDNSDERYLDYNKYRVPYSYATRTISYIYFYYTNKKINNSIITNFKFSNGFPCIDSSETSWVSAFENEVDENPTCKNSIEINGEKINRDYRYIEVNGSNISLAHLYHDNDISATGSNSTRIKENVTLYFRNYFDDNEDCLDKYFSDIEEEEKKYKNIEKKIIILCSISASLLFILIVYSGLICCLYFIKVFWFFIIAHIYGIAVHIASMIIIFRKKVKYNCDDEEGFNNKINDILNKNYLNNRAFVLSMCILTIITIIFNLLSIICLRLNKKRIFALSRPKMPTGMTDGTEQSVNIQQTQDINPENEIQNLEYSNPQEINNEINPIPDEIIDNNDNPPPSDNPLEKN